MRDVGQARQVNVARNRHAARVDFQNRQAPVPVRNRDADLAVKAPGATQRRVDGVGDVGGGYDDHLAACLQAVHQTEQLRDNAALDLVLTAEALALGCDRVNFVDEDDAGRLLGRIVKQLAQKAFGLAVELLHDLGAADGEEAHIGLVRHGARDQRLAAAGRAVQQHALGGVDAQAHKDLGEAQRQLDDFAHALHLALEAANVFVGKSRAAGRVGAARLGLRRAHAEQGGRRNQHRPFGLRFAHHKVERAIAKQRAADAVAFDDRQPVQAAADVLQVAVRQTGSRGREHDALRRLCRDFLHRDGVVECNAGVGAREAVKLNAGRAALVLVGRHQLAHGAPFADHFNDVADVGAQGHDVGRVHARQCAPDVLAERLGDFQARAQVCGFFHGRAFFALSFLSTISSTPLRH